MPGPFRHQGEQCISGLREERVCKELQVDLECPSIYLSPKSRVILDSFVHGNEVSFRVRIFIDLAEELDYQLFFSIRPNGPL